MTESKDVKQQKPDGKSNDQAENPRPAQDPVTKITPLDQKIPEGPGNLRSREEAFKRRHGTTS